MNELHPLNGGLISTILLACFLLIGCDSNDTSADSEIASITIQPKTASIQAGDQEDFSIVLLNANDEPVQDATVDVRWWSTDTTVFEVDENGAALAKSEGTAYCMVEVTELAKAARFTGRDSAFVTVMF